MACGFAVAQWLGCRATSRKAPDASRGNLTPSGCVREVHQRAHRRGELRWPVEIGDVPRAFKLDVLRTGDGVIAEITTFGANLFPAFGLPGTLGPGTP